MIKFIHNWVRIVKRIKINIIINGTANKYFNMVFKKIIQSYWNQILKLQWHIFNRIYSDVLFKIMSISEFFPMWQEIMKKMGKPRDQDL